MFRAQPNSSSRGIGAGSPIANQPSKQLRSMRPPPPPLPSLRSSALVLVLLAACSSPASGRAVPLASPPGTASVAPAPPPVGRLPVVSGKEQTFLLSWFYLFSFSFLGRAAAVASGSCCLSLLKMAKKSIALVLLSTVRFLSQFAQGNLLEKCSFHENKKKLKLEVDDRGPSREISCVYWSPWSQL